MINCSVPDDKKQVKIETSSKEYSYVPFNDIFRKDVKFGTHYTQLEKLVNFEYSSIHRDENLELDLGIFHIDGRIRKYPPTYCTLFFDDSCLIKVDIHTDYIKISSNELLKVQRQYVRLIDYTTICTEYFEGSKGASIKMEATQR